jgi:hypothetical protein
MNVTIEDPDNSGGSPAYDGPSNLVHTRLQPGEYDGHDDSGHAVTVVVTDGDDGPQTRVKVAALTVSKDAPRSEWKATCEQAYNRLYALSPDGQDVTPLEYDGRPGCDWWSTYAHTPDGSFFVTVQEV